MTDKKSEQNEPNALERARRRLREQADRESRDLIARLRAAAARPVPIAPVVQVRPADKVEATTDRARGADLIAQLRAAAQRPVASQPLTGKVEAITDRARGSDGGNMTYEEAVEAMRISGRRDRTHPNPLDKLKF